MVQDVIEEMGSVCPQFSWGGANYFIVPGSAMFNQPLRSGGFTQMYDFTCLTTVSQFGGPPATTLMKTMLNTGPLTYLGVQYKIENVEILSGATMLRIVCNSLNQNV